MTEKDNAQLIVQLEARVADFEKSFKRASRVASTEWNKIEKRGKDASRRMQLDLTGVSKSAASSMTTFTRSFAAAGGLAAVMSFSGAIGKARQALTDFDKIAKTARATGLGSDFYQALGFAATEASVSTEELNGALLGFAKRAAEASIGKGEMVEKLKQLNPELLRAITNARSNEERLRLVAEAMRQAKDETERAAIAYATLGESSAKLIPIFAGGAAALDDFRRRAAELGLIIDEKLLAKSEELETKLGVLSKVIDTNLNQALVTLAPLLVKAAEEVAIFAKEVREFADSDLFRFLGRFNDALKEGQGPVDAAVSAWKQLNAEAPALARQSAEAGERIESLETSISRLQARLVALRQAEANGEIIPRDAIAFTEEQIARLIEELDLLKDGLAEVGDAGVNAANRIATAIANSALHVDELRRHLAHLPANTTRAGKPSISAAPGDKLSALEDDFEASLREFIAAAEEAGHKLTVTSGFRTIEHQQRLWEEAVRKYGSEAEARKWVAPPGKSFHNSGQAADLGFGTDVARIWAHANAARLGLAFPLGNEPWHLEPAGLRGGGTMGDPEAPDAAARDEAAEAAKRQQAAIDIERHQLTRNDLEQRLHLELQRADVELNSAAGQAIRAKVEALYAEEQALLAVEEAQRKAAEAAEETARRNAQAAEQWNGLVRDSLSGFLSDLRNGVSFADALSNALGRLADRLIDLALNAMFAGPGGIGGVLAGIFGFSRGGQVPGFASGGKVRGPGNGTSDSILARVSAGEYIVRASEAQKHLRLLEAINSGTLPAFANGGLVGTPQLSSRPPGDARIHINAPVTVNASGGTKEQNADLAKQVGAQLEDAMRSTVVQELLRQRRPGGLLAG